MKKDIVVEIRNKSMNSLYDMVTAAAVIEDVLNKPTAEAANFVWYALCNPEDAVKKLQLEYTGEAARIFSNELRYQFSKYFPEKPLEIEASTGCIFKTAESHAFLILEVKTTSFVAHKIFEKILEYSFYNLTAINRAGYLLRATAPKNPSEEQLKKAEKLYYGGLCEIFTNRDGGENNAKDIAEFLKPYHKEISNLYDEFMYLKFPNYNQNTSTKDISKVETNFKDLEIQAKAISQIEEVTQSAKISQTVEVAKNTETAKISKEAVIANQELISEYFDIIEKLMAAGIDPDILKSNESKVKALLEALKAF